MSAEAGTPLGACQLAAGERGLHRQATAITHFHSELSGGKAHDLAFRESP
jgi:hypothetical protein